MKPMHPDELPLSSFGIMQLQYAPHPSTWVFAEKLVDLPEFTEIGFLPENEACDSSLVIDMSDAQALVIRDQLLRLFPLDSFPIDAQRLRRAHTR